MIRTAFALLFAGAFVQAKPLASYGSQQAAQVSPAFSPVSAQGTAHGKLIRNDNVPPHGGSPDIVQQQQQQQHVEQGHVDIGMSYRETQPSLPQQGTRTSSTTSAQSIQGSVPELHGSFPVDAVITPAQPLNVFPVSGAGSATGTAGGNIVRGETQLPGGGTSTTIQQGSSAGGQASGGGINVGKSSTGTESVATQHGTSTKSDTDAHSMQGSLPGSVPVLPQFTGSLTLPQHQGFQFQPGHSAGPFAGLLPGHGSGSATGTAGGNIVRGETQLPGGGTSTTVQQGSSAGGQAEGGGFSIGGSSTGTESLATQHGVSTKSDTDAHSMQGSLPGSGARIPQFTGSLNLPQHQGFQFQPGHSAGPSLALLPGHGSGSATGTAGGNIVRGETVDKYGGKSTTVSQGSSAGGQASGGGINVGRSSTDTESVATQHGTSTKSDTDAHSMQGSLPGSGASFPQFTGSLNLPQHQGFQFQPGHSSGPFGGLLPGHGSGSATGTAGGNIVRGETQLPGGGTSTTIQQGSSAGGQASGGGINVGRSSTGTESVATQHGTSTKSDTDAHSMQGSLPGSLHGQGLFGPQGFGGAGFPPAQSMHVFPASLSGQGFGTATGQAGSSLKQGETTGPHGGTSKFTSMGSSAGGSARDGGTNVSKASGTTSSVDTAEGSQTRSHTDAESIQTSRR